MCGKFYEIWFNRLIRVIARQDAFGYIHTEIMKKVLGETQTLRADRSNAKPKIFSPAAEPFPRV